MQKPIDNDDCRHYIFKGEHLHVGDSRIVGKKRIMTKIKTSATTTKNFSRQIIAQSLRGAKKATLATLASEKSLVKTIQRCRQGKDVPKNPCNVSELVLPPEYRKTVKNADFLLFDSAESTDEVLEDQGRILIFATTENLKFMARCTHIYMDGTFTVVPVLFKQLYTVHGNFSKEKVNCIRNSLLKINRMTY